MTTADRAHILIADATTQDRPDLKARAGPGRRT